MPPRRRHAATMPSARKRIMARLAGLGVFAPETRMPTVARKRARECQPGRSDKIAVKSDISQDEQSNTQALDAR